MTKIDRLMPLRETIFCQCYQWIHSLDKMRKF